MQKEMSIISENETMTPSEPLTALEAITTKFDTMDWKYTRNTKKVEFRFPARPLTGQCVARLQGEDFILILVTFGLFVPEQARTAMVRLMNRNNWKLLMGNLEMDEEDGEVRLRYTYPLVAGCLDGERAVGAIMHICKLAGNLAIELLQASATVAFPSESDASAITIQ